MNRRRFFQALGVLLTCLFAFAFTGASAEAKAQPHMKAALGLLKKAKKQLQTATHDKGGHRVKALGHVNSAIVFVNKGISYDNSHAVAQEAQPHMKAALNLLKSARKQLIKAVHTKGGFRVKAIAQVGKAIAEVNKGIAFDNAH